MREHCPDIPSQAHRRNLPDEDRASHFADWMIRKLKSWPPELQWAELETILDPDVISDFVIDQAIITSEPFDMIIERVGKMVICTELIQLYEDTKIAEYYIDNY